MDRRDLSMGIAQQLKDINDDAGAFVAGLLSDDISWEDQIDYNAMRGVVRDELTLF